jgi:hypothetical protein
VGGNTLAGIFYLKAHRPIYRDRLNIDIEQVNSEIEERMAQLRENPDLFARAISRLTEWKHHPEGRELDFSSYWEFQYCNMSWDIFVQDLPRDAKTVADIPDDFKPAVIGARSEIISMIKEVVPTANFSDLHGDWLTAMVGLLNSTCVAPKSVMASRFTFAVERTLSVLSRQSYSTLTCVH